MSSFWNSLKEFRCSCLSIILSSIVSLPMYFIYAKIESVHYNWWSQECVMNESLSPGNSRIVYASFVYEFGSSFFFFFFSISFMISPVFKFCPWNHISHGMDLFGSHDIRKLWYIYICKFEIWNEFYSNNCCFVWSF